MPILPVAANRTSTALTNQRLLFQLNADQLAIQRQYDQMSTGRRVLRLSDDPAAASRSISLHREIDRGDQMVRNGNATLGFYDSSDDSLSRVGSALIQARAAATEGAQTVISQAEREALAITVREAMQSVFAAGNAMFRDHQLLGGILNTGNAFQHHGADVVFAGKDAVGRTQFGAGAPSSINVTAADSLGAFSTIIEGESLGASLDHGTRLVDMRGGRGVTPGVMRLSAGGEFVEVDLRSAGTIGDVVDVLSALEIEGRRLDVQIGADTLRITYADGLSGTLAIEDTVGSTLARDLSIANPGGLHAPPIIGDLLTPRVTTITKIEDLAFGAGVDLSSGIVINQGDKTFSIDLAQAKTVGDVLIAINRSGADIHAELNEAEGRLRLRSLRSGVDYSIGENGGSAARSLGIRSATEQTKLSELGRGRGVALNTDAADLIITRPNGVEIALNLETAETVDDVIRMIQDHPNNQGTTRVLVGLNSVGNGIELQAPPGDAPMSVRQTELSNAGNRLGLIPAGQNEVLGVDTAGVNQISGVDYLPRDAGGAIDTLIRLERAILDADINEIERLQVRVDEDLNRANSTRAKVGIWSRNLQQLKDATETSVVQMKEQLSNEIDADMATVISELSQRQVAMEASMRLIAQTSQITVLNFL